MTKFCRFHLDREAVYKSRLCRECFTDRQREYRRGRNIEPNAEKERDELNMEDLIKDAVNGWDLKNLCRRYKSYSYEKICKVLTDNGIPLKKEQSKRNMNKDGYTGYSTPDMLDWTCSIKPTHQKARVICG